MTHVSPLTYIREPYLLRYPIKVSNHIVQILRYTLFSFTDMLITIKAWISQYTFKQYTTMILQLYTLLNLNILLFNAVLSLMQYYTITGLPKDL